MTTTDGQPLENEQKTPPAVTRSRRKARRWSYATKRRIVEETMLPGSSVSIVARQHDVNANLVFFWRKLYRAGRLCEGGGGPGFIQVGVVSSEGASPAPVPRSAVLMELELAGGIRLRVDSRIEEAALQRVLRAVKSSA